MIDLYNFISENEKTLITEYIKEYSKPIEAPLDYILRIWNEYKQNLFKLFGGESLILEKEICFNKSSEDFYEEFSSRYKMKIFFDNYYKATEYYYFGKYRQYYQNDNEFDEAYYNLGSLIRYNYLVSNIYSGPTFIVRKNENQSVKIEHGMKIIKALKKISDLLEIKGFEDFRIEHSQVLNQKTLVGNICLSIHPMDYMTMSDNDCGWSSCMSWDYGDYRMGTVEMMNSNCVVVAYLKSKSDFRPCGSCEEWNSKKWRCLYIVNEHMITEVKQYPYVNDNLGAEIMNWLKELAGKNMKWNYHPVKFLIRDGLHGNNSTITILDENKPDYKFNFMTGEMYSDMYDDHNAYLNPDIPHSLDIDYSGPTECMCCGETTYNSNAPSSLMLSCCDDTVHCCCCEEYIDEDSAIIYNGEYYCSYCYEEHFRVCEFCEDSYHRDDTKNIRIYKDGIIMEDVNTLYICYDCYVRDFLNRVKIVAPSNWWEPTHFAIELSDLKEFELNYFSLAWDTSLDEETFHKIWEEAVLEKENAKKEIEDALNTKI